MNAQYATATQSGTAISISNSIDSSLQDGGVKAPTQLKARRQKVLTVTATLLGRSEVCLIALSSINSLILFFLG